MADFEVKKTRGFNRFFFMASAIFCFINFDQGGSVLRSNYNKLLPLKQKVFWTYARPIGPTNLADRNQGISPPRE
jgi:hypothetical protein